MHEAVLTLEGNLARLNLASMQLHPSYMGTSTTQFPPLANAVDELRTALKPETGAVTAEEFKVQLKQMVSTALREQRIAEGEAARAMISKFARRTPMSPLAKRNCAGGAGSLAAQLTPPALRREAAH